MTQCSVQSQAPNRFALWRGLGGRLNTTAGGVELAMLRAFAGLRTVIALQMSLAVITLVHRSPNPVLDVLLAAAFIVESVVFVGASLRRGTMRHTAAVWADVSFGVVILLGQPFIAAAENRINAWDAWGYAVTLSCAVLVGTALPRVQAWVATIALSVAYMAVSMPAAAGEGELWTAATNSLGYAAFALVGWLIASYLRRLGQDADTARALAAQLGAEAERDRTRLLLHDHAALLAMVGRGGGHPELQEALQKQAARGAAAVVSFMAAAAGISDDGTPRDLGGVVRDAADEFPDLPLTVNADLADHLTLSSSLAHTVGGAIVTLLHNVRKHSHAMRCVVHAEADAAGTTWEVVVRDDGVGFNPGEVSQGFGLSRQVRAAALEAGIGVHIESAPGNGTAVTLAWPATGPATGTDSP